MKVGIAINAIVYFYHTINLFRFRFHQGIMKLCFGLNKKMLYPATQVVKGAEKKKKKLSTRNISSYIIDSITKISTPFRVASLYMGFRGK